MRAVLQLAVGLLVLTLGLNVAAHLALDMQSGGGERATLAVIAAAKGPLLPAGALPGESQVLANAILVGDAILRFEEGESGLSAAVVEARAGGLELGAHRRFDLAASAEARAALPAWIAELPPRVVLVLANHGRFGPPEGLDREPWRALAAELGARADPFSNTPCSWALITYRSRKGWVALAEGFSDEVGVVLSFLLDRDLARYTDYRGDLVVPEPEGRVEVELERELAGAERDADVVHALAPVGGVRLPSIHVPPARADAQGRVAPRAVRWVGVLLGREAELRCAVGLRDGGWDNSDGVEFAVLVDGAEIAALRLQAADPPRTWLPLAADLGAYAGRTVELALEVRPLASSPGDQALWGQPRLAWRAERGE